MMGVMRRSYRVHRNLDVPVRSILEANGARQPGRELAVELALRGARANGAPTDKIRDVLRRQHVEVFHSRRNTHIVEGQQQLASDAQTIVDLVAAVQVGI